MKSQFRVLPKRENTSLTSVASLGNFLEGANFQKMVKIRGVNPFLDPKIGAKVNFFPFWRGL